MAGVPEGSILGPMLNIIHNISFNKYNCIHVKHFVYADDTGLGIFSSDLQTCMNLLQKYYNKILKWCNDCVQKI